MNSNNNEIVIEQPVLIDSQSKPNRESKPKLPAKLERYMIFGYWFSQKLKQTDVITDEKFGEMLNELKVFESLETQQSLYESFETALGATQKTLRKMIADHHKPPKVAKANKPKKAVTVVDGQVSASKKGRKKKASEIVVDNHNDFINQLVAVANLRESENPVVSVEPQVTQIIVSDTASILLNNQVLAVAPQEPKLKKKAAIQKVNELVAGQPAIVSEKKPRKKAVAANVATVATVADEVNVIQVVEPIVTQAVVTQAVVTQAVEQPITVAAVTFVEPKVKKTKAEKSEKAKKTPKVAKADKPKKDTMTSVKISDELTINVYSNDYQRTPEERIAAAEASSSEDEEEEEIHAREFVLNGKHYLIDENTNDVYDISTQDLIGQYDANLKQIIT